MREEQEKRIKAALEEWKMHLDGRVQILMQEYLSGKHTIRKLKNLIGEDTVICTLPRSVRRALTPVRLKEGKYLPE